MVVLDTNVISELMRDEVSGQVLAWLDDQPVSELFVTAVTEAQVLTGIAMLPKGIRREELTIAAKRAFSDLFAQRILPFDSQAARPFAEIVASRRAAGRPAAQADCQIAAIARSRNMSVATRNVRDFSNMGIVIVDPWNLA